MAALDVLIVGSGGREHALAWKISQSPQIGRLFVAPGNAGTAAVATNVPISSEAIEELVRFALDEAVALVVIGPEAPLAAGIVDRCREAGLTAFGPTAAVAQLESSKAFAKGFMLEHDIPTARARVFSEHEDALAFLRERPGPVVIKASGLAAGKGVIVCDDLAAAEAALQLMFVDRAFGAAADEVLIEERLQGPEVSLLAFCDGRTSVPMLPARDYKRALDGDLGANTGGMGAIAPAADVSPELVAEIMARIITPVVEGMAAAGTPYHGVLYAGVMLTSQGPQVLEYNCRFGDPETQVILPLLEADLLAIMLACTQGELQADMVKVNDGSCVAVVMAAPGYPGPYPKGLPISGVETLTDPQIVVFHAGTTLEDGRLVTDGGRVLAVSGRGDDRAMAVDRAYSGVEQISFEDAHYRHDIGRVQAAEAQDE